MLEWEEPNRKHCSLDDIGKECAEQWKRQVYNTMIGKTEVRRGWGRHQYTPVYK